MIEQQLNTVLLGFSIQDRRRDMKDTRRREGGCRAVEYWWPQYFCVDVVSGPKVSLGSQSFCCSVQTSLLLSDGRFPATLLQLQ